MLDSAPPSTCDVAFKEWAGICAAIGTGRQSILIRKGGVAEGPGGFVPDAAAFWLYPTFVHQAEQGLRAPADIPAPPRGFVDLDVFVRVAGLAYLDRLEALDAIADLHDWTSESIRRRFHYRRPGLWLLVIRAHRPPRPFRIEEEAAYLGCKSWVPLVEGLSIDGLTPVIDDRSHLALIDRLRPILASDLGEGRSDS